MANYNDLYEFLCRGVLADESLDKAGRTVRAGSSDAEFARIAERLSFDMLDEDAVTAAKRMSVVYSAVHAFENMVRKFVHRSLVDEFKDDWWSHVPERIQKRVAGRMDEDAKFRWHGTRGRTEMYYCDFGDLSSIIVTNWSIFEVTLQDMEWTKSLLGVLERSRNIVMHGGALAIQDIERIGINIRDWVRQTG